MQLMKVAKEHGVRLVVEPVDAEVLGDEKLRRKDPDDLDHEGVDRGFSSSTWKDEKEIAATADKKVEMFVGLNSLRRGHCKEASFVDWVTNLAEGPLVNTDGRDMK